MRDSAHDCQAHVETRTFRRTLISLPSLSPFLHSPIETLFHPCPRIHTLLTRPTPFVLCSSRLCHSARILHHSVDSGHVALAGTARQREPHERGPT